MHLVQILNFDFAEMQTQKNVKQTLDLSTSFKVSEQKGTNLICSVPLNAFVYSNKMMLLGKTTEV